MSPAAKLRAVAVVTEALALLSCTGLHKQIGQCWLQLIEAWLACQAMFWCRIQMLLPLVSSIRQ